MPDLKLVVLDIDGTITNSNHINVRTRAALAAVREKGVDVAVATGRQFCGVETLISSVGLRGPQIVVGGALIIDSCLSEPLWGLKLPEAAVSAMLTTIEAMQLTALFALGRNSVAVGSNAGYEDLIQRGIPIPSRNRPEDMNRRCYGITVAGRLSGEQTGVLQQIIQARPEIHGSSAAPNFVDFVHQDASKGRALQWLLRRRNLPPECVLAIGDSDNDISLFKAAGVRIAVANASAGLLELADRIVPSCDDNGVAIALEGLVLQSGTNPFRY